MLTKLQINFIKIISIISLFSLWVIFEETIIDRQGLWKYLPGYRYGCFCLWDIGALAIISTIVLLVFKQKIKISGNETTQTLK